MPSSIQASPKLTRGLLQGRAPECRSSNGRSRHATHHPFEAVSVSLGTPVTPGCLVPFHLHFGITCSSWFAPSCAVSMPGAFSMHRAADDLHLQDEMEPICIDSDDDVHAPGSGPAREGNQNGAALATRHSTRNNRFQTTTQVFKVVLPT